MYSEFSGNVIKEIADVLSEVDETKLSHLVQSILGAKRVIVHGAGRVGFACRGFAMRLGQLGLSAYSPGDSTIRPVAGGDLLIVGSSSGETQTVLDVSILGKNHGAEVILITASPDSRMGKVADSILYLKAPTKFGPTEECASIQPMATLFEQSLQIVFDIVVLLLMKKTGQKHNDLWARHTNLD